MILRKNFLALSGALLILLQCVVASGMSMPIADNQTEVHHPEVKSGDDVAFQTNYLETTSRITFSTQLFLFFLDSGYNCYTLITNNTYEHYQNFYGHAYTFNCYYTHLTALAP